MSYLYSGILTIGIGCSLTLPAIAQSQDSTGRYHLTEATALQRDLSRVGGRSPSIPTDLAPFKPSQAQEPSVLPSGFILRMAEAPSAVIVTNCYVVEESNTDIIHVMGNVQNRTGQSVQLVTVRYGVFGRTASGFQEPSAIFDRRGQLINENTLLPSGTGTFDRRDQPIRKPSRPWIAVVEGVDWQENRVSKRYRLEQPQVCR